MLRAPDEWTRAEKDAARAILLEASPVEADRGEMIGRDPRRIPNGEFEHAGLSATPIMAVIRAKCVDCCGGQTEEVRKCVAITCPNWPYRMGVNPFRVINLTDEERARRSAVGKANIAAAHRRRGNP
jgi:hypothetical protein